MIPGADRLHVQGFPGADVLDAELATLSDVIGGVTVVSTVPATGSNTLQLQFNNTAGNPVTGVRGIAGWISNAGGQVVPAITSQAAAVNGSVSPTTPGQAFDNVTTATGLLGILSTGAAGTYYYSFRLPNGKVITTPAVVIN